MTACKPPPEIYEFSNGPFERITNCDVDGCTAPWVKLRSGPTNRSDTREHLCIDHRDGHANPYYPERMGTMDWELTEQRRWLKRWHKALWKRLSDEEGSHDD